MNTTSGSDESMMTTNETSSTSAENSQSGENTRTNSALKKGPWTASEDAILIEYVQKNGEGNWNVIQKHTELARCGKSCRLRWTNHLKPDLKKGAFSQEEERIVVEMQAKLGNKWARMASELPGRTDNEIKNFWNTRLKRRQRMGLPIYPSDMQPSTEHQLSDHPIAASKGNHTRSTPINGYQYPLTEFAPVDENECAFPGFPLTNLMSQRPVISYPSNDALFSNMFQLRPTFTLAEFQDYGYNSQIQGNFAASLPVYNNQGLSSNHVFSTSSSPSSSAIFGSNAFVNLNSSLELPSIQMQRGAWGVSASPSSSSSTLPLPAFESRDMTSAQTLLTDNIVVSMQNSGLLDAVVRESQVNSGLLGQVLHGSSSQTMNTNADSSMAANALPRDIQEMEWGMYCPPISSSSSLLSGGTLISTNSSLDELECVCLNPGEANNSMVPEMNFDDLNTMYDNIFFGPDQLPNLP